MTQTACKPTVTVSRAGPADVPALRADAECFARVEAEKVAERARLNAQLASARASKKLRLDKIAELLAAAPPPPPVPAPAVLRIVTPPRIVGDPVVGGELRVEGGEVEGGERRVIWTENGHDPLRNIDGPATGATYRPTPDDGGRSIAVYVFAFRPGEEENGRMSSSQWVTIRAAAAPPVAPPPPPPAPTPAPAPPPPPSPKPAPAPSPAPAPAADGPFVLVLGPRHDPHGPERQPVRPGDALTIAPGAWPEGADLRFFVARGAEPPFGMGGVGCERYVVKAADAPELVFSVVDLNGQGAPIEVRVPVAA